MFDISETKKLYGAFVLAYALSFMFITLELLNSPYYSVGLLQIYVLIFLCATICMALGWVENTKARIILLSLLVCICGKGFMGYNIMPSMWDAGKLVLVILFYAGVGWYPANRWITSRYGLVLKILSAIAIGNLAFTVIATTALSFFGLYTGGMLALFTALALCATGLFAENKGAGGAKKRFAFTSEDAQIVGAMILIFIVNAVFMNQQYPHGAPLGYVRFMQDVLAFGEFPPEVMYGGFEKRAHYAVLSVPPLLAHILQLQLSWATYFELIVGLGAMLVSAYLFSRLVISDKHSTALFSMIFVSLLGEMHLYAAIISLLFEGQGIGEWLVKVNGVRSLTAPMSQPWSLACYIDNGKSLAAMLLAFYIILSGVKDKLALLFVGISVMMVVGGGQEEILYAFGLAGVFIAASNHRHYFHKDYLSLLIGGLLGTVMWVYLTAHSGSLKMLNNSSGIFIRPISDWGLYLYRSPGTPQLEIPMTNLHALFSWKTMMYVLSEWSMLAIFCFFAIRATKNRGFERVRLAIPIALIIPALLPLFVGLSFMMVWDLNRFIQPLLFWLYLWAGIGFVYVFSELNKNTVLTLTTGTVILFIVIYPTIHFANTQLVLAISRIQ